MTHCEQNYLESKSPTSYAQEPNEKATEKSSSFLTSRALFHFEYSTSIQQAPPFLGFCVVLFLCSFPSLALSLSFLSVLLFLLPSSLFFDPDIFDFFNCCYFVPSNQYRFWWPKSLIFPGITCKHFLKKSRWFLSFFGNYPNSQLSA